MPPRLSIIIPFYNEEENVIPVLEEVRLCQPEAEVVAVDDGSRDATLEKIRSFPGVVCLTFPRNLGQSAAFYHGLHRATGEVCVMMDGDGQNDPSDIAALLSHMDQGDVVCGYRRTRRDSWSKRAASRIANHIRKTVLGDGIRDTGCSLKAVRREHLRYLVPFNAMHRFIPALLVNCGLKIVEVPVNHRHRTRGVSKYTVAGRAWRGLRDLLGVRWFLSRQIRWDLDPHHHV